MHVNFEKIEKSRNWSTKVRLEFAINTKIFCHSYVKTTNVKLISVEVDAKLRPIIVENSSRLQRQRIASNIQKIELFQVHKMQKWFSPDVDKYYNAIASFTQIQTCRPCSLSTFSNPNPMSLTSWGSTSKNDTIVISGMPESSSPRLGSSSISARLHAW